MVLAVFIIINITTPVLAGELYPGNPITNSSNSFTKAVEAVGQKIGDIIAQEPGNLLEKAIAYLIGGIASGLLWAVQKLTGAPSLFEAVFITKTPDNMQPFTKAQFDVMNYWYQVMIFIAVVILFISLLFVAFEMIFVGFNPKSKDEIKERIERIIFSGIIIAATPMFFKILLYMNNALTYYIYKVLRLPGNIDDMFDPTVVFANIHTGSVVLTAIGMLVMAYINAFVVFVFTVRKFVIMIFYIFTPIAATLWSINKNILAAKVWLGELLTNIFTQFFYAFVFAVYFSATGVVHQGNNTVNVSTSLESLLWLYMITAIAESLRNSLQGYFTRLAGINEAGIARNVALAFGASSAVTAISTIGAQFGTAAAMGGAVGQAAGTLAKAFTPQNFAGMSTVPGIDSSSTGLKSSGGGLSGGTAGSLSHGSGPMLESGSTIGGGTISGVTASGGAAPGGPAGGFAAGSSTPAGIDTPEFMPGMSSGPVMSDTGAGTSDSGGGTASPVPGYASAEQFNAGRTYSNTPTGGVIGSSEESGPEQKPNPYSDPRYALARSAESASKVAHYGTMLGGLADRSLGFNRGFGSLATKGGAALYGTARAVTWDALKTAHAQDTTWKNALYQMTGVDPKSRFAGLRAVKRIAHTNISAAFSGPHSVSMHMQKYHNTSLDGYRWKM
ncbi:hypothetical protein [Thermoanaerobacter thermohydrosulfuricus]|uniref:hypothetical protein n=1 Tax=Thermoanaerobacter thermohydrosulfuricus TaxID=1516 RepID=UPI00117D7167|nr:hypothetical protein [Thermoanaerobacter thermohydrosulfuricus]